MKTYTYQDTKVYLKFRGRYSLNNTPRIEMITEEGFPYMTVTVAMEQHDPISIAEVCIKNYSENEGVYEWLVENKIIVPMNVNITSGFISSPLANIVDKDLLMQMGIDIDNAEHFDVNVEPIGPF